MTTYFYAVLPVKYSYLKYNFNVFRWNSRESLLANKYVNFLKNWTRLLRLQMDIHFKKNYFFNKMLHTACEPRVVKFQKIACINKRKEFNRNKTHMWQEKNFLLLSDTFKCLSETELVTFSDTFRYGKMSRVCDYQQLQKLFLPITTCTSLECMRVNFTFKSRKFTC